MKRLTNVLLILFFVFSLQGCGGDEPSPPHKSPSALTEDAIGFFCGMQVSAHSGPKGQVFLKGQDSPIWFVSVRDSLAYSRMPGEKFKISIVYVSDMGVAANWDQPGDDAWIRAEGAWYVLGSSRTGGMGMAEVVPFSDKAKAEDFIASYGGALSRLNDIATDVLLGSNDGGMTLGGMDKDETVNDKS